MDEIDISNLLITLVLLSPTIILYIYFIRGHKVETGTNSNETNQKLFLELLEKSKHSLQIYDDGYTEDSDPNPLYDNSLVLSELKKKLDENDKFQLDIHFNYYKKLKILKLQNEYPNQVCFKYTPNFENAQKEIQQKDIYREHFKIFDEGEYCLISKHQEKQTKRPYKKYKKTKFSLGHFDVIKCEMRFAKQENSFVTK